jgi:hypothetical protein
MSPSTLTLGGGDRTLIEVGGPDAGNPAGRNDIDGFDCCVAGLSSEKCASR